MSGKQSTGRGRGYRRRQVEPDDPGRDLGPPADPASVARNIVLTKLTGQPRSRKELADSLAARDVPDDIAEEVLRRFEDVGLVDDAAFAEAWVRSRQASRGLSRRVLGQELRRKGVDDEIVRDAVETIDTEGEIAAARRLVDRKLRTMGRLDRQTRFRRLSGLLARKGYSAGLSARVVREAIDAAGGDGRGGDGAHVDDVADR